jgi:ABC-type sugar transport system substrate-binding protein
MVQGKCHPSYESQVNKIVDTARFKKPSPWVIGIAAADLESSYIVFEVQEIKYAMSQDRRYSSKVVVLNANFNAATQATQVEELVSEGVSAIMFWPQDMTALAPALRKAEAAGIPTIDVANGYSNSSSVTADAQVDVYAYSVKSAYYLFKSLNGKGNVVQVETIPGTSSNGEQGSALTCVRSFFPGIKLVDSEAGEYSQATTKVVAAAWAQRFGSSLNGIYSTYAEPSLGAAQAFEEAGVLDSVKFAPANEENGWLVFLKQHPAQNLGVLLYPVTVGKTGVGITTKILEGKSVPRGTFLGGQYLTPHQAAAMAEPNKPASWWPDSNLPTKFLPR